MVMDLGREPDEGERAVGENTIKLEDVLSTCMCRKTVKVGLLVLFVGAGRSQSFVTVG
jgi:hypothetical protein